MTNGIAGSLTGATFQQRQAEILLSRLDRVKQTRPDRWQARCPAHEDRTPSLSITETADGTILLRCWAGCGAEAIVKAVGLDLRDLFPFKLDIDHRPPKLPRYSAREVLDGLRSDLWVCSLAFSDLSHGKPFTPTDAETIAHHAAHLAGTLAEVRHV